MNNEEIINLLEEKFRKLILFLYGWLTTDAEILGYILGVCHFTMSITIFSVLIIAHTIYPTLWLQSLILFGIGLIWFQHITLKVCIVITAEERLTKTKAPFFTIVEDMTKFLNISFDKLLDNIIIAETMTILCFGLALIGRFSVLIHKKFQIPC